MLINNPEVYKGKRPIDTEFFRRASDGTVGELKRLVAAGANPDAPIYNEINDDFYAIHQAALNPDIEVLKYIVSLGVNPCRIDFWARQPISLAVRRNSLDIVKYLVERGNDPCGVDDDGMTVLAEASLNPDVHVLDYLISLGADGEVGATDRTPLGYALTDGTVERMRYFIDHGGDLAKAMENKAYWAPLANLRFALENGYNPNSYEWGESADGKRYKIIDHLDPVRRKLFEEFGGVIETEGAELYNEDWMSNTFDPDDDDDDDDGVSYYSATGLDKASAVAELSAVIEENDRKDGLA